MVGEDVRDLVRDDRLELLVDGLAELHWTTSERSAVAAVGEHPHDAVLLDAALCGESTVRDLLVSLAFIFGMGFAIVSCVAVVNTLLQQLVTDEMRGRVMSMFILSFIGAMPIGNLLAGTSAQRFGAPRTLAMGGLIIVLFTAVVTLRNKRLRDLY